MSGGFMSGGQAVIVAWLIRGHKYDFHVKIIGLSGYERKRPFKFYMRNGRIITDEKIYFGVLYGQICYLVKRSFKEQGKVSQLVRGASQGQKRNSKKKIPASAYYHQLRCQEAGACD